MCAPGGRVVCECVCVFRDVGVVVVLRRGEHCCSVV